MARHRKNPHMAFWRMLKEGNDHFELTKTQPKIDVCEKRYVFNAHLADPSQLFDPKGQCPIYDVPTEIASAVTAKRQSDDREMSVLARLVPAAPIVTGRDGDTHPTLAGNNRPAAPVTAVLPTSDEAGRALAVSGPKSETVTGSTGSSTAAVPAPPGDPRRGGTTTAGTPGAARASLGGNGTSRGRTPSRETPEQDEPAAAQPAKDRFTAPPALPGATPIRSSGGFSYR
jgi:hypothetical protein